MHPQQQGPIVASVFLDDGTLLYAFAGLPSADSLHSKIYVNRSTDLGRTFTATEIRPRPRSAISYDSLRFTELLPCTLGTVA